VSGSRSLIVTTNEAMSAGDTTPYASVVVNYTANVGSGSFAGPNSSTGFGVALSATTPVSMTAYSNLSSTTTAGTQIGLGIPNALGTTATILTYTNSSGSDTGVNMAWRSRQTTEASAAEANGTLPVGFLLSDVVDVTGMVNSGAASGQTDPFVLQVSYNDALVAPYEATIASGGKLFLATLSGGNWINATDTNFLADTGSTVNNYSGASGGNNAGSWASFVSQFGVTPSTIGNYIGSWGVDQVSNQAWAVVDHNSQFAVIPEPSTLVLGGLALLGFAGVGLRRRRLAKQQA
jgi:hypothetical protein